MWFPAFVSETDFKIPLVGGVLEVDLVKCRDQYLIEVCGVSSHGLSVHSRPSSAGLCVG